VVVLGVVLAVAAAALVAVLVVRSQSGGSTASNKIDPVATLPASADPQQAAEAAVIKGYLAGLAAYKERRGE